MKKTKVSPRRSTLRAVVLALAVSALSSQLAQAHPYASGLTNNSGTISFILNESADSVQVAFDNAGAGYTTTNNLGALTNGVQSFALGAHTNYAIIVSKGGNGIPFKISQDANRFVNFGLPEGIAVNKNPKTSNFGRIYVCDSAGGANGSTWGGVVSRTTTQGVYLLNADQSDAVGQGDTALTAGLSVDTTASVSAVPYKISVGPDDMVYFGDCRGQYGTPHYAEAGAGIYMAAPDFSTGQDLFPFGSTTMFGGVDGKPCVTGSLAKGNLVVYAYEWDNASPADPMVWRYDIGAGPLPWSTPPPTFFLDAWQVGVNYVEGDTTLSPDGTLLYVMLDRGTPGSSQPPLCIYRTNSFTGTTLQQANAIWNCETVLGTTHDPFQYCYSFDISPDGQQLATADGLSVNGPIEVMSLTNGMPDISTFHCVDTGMDGANATGGNGSSIRGICFDAAGNVYASTRAGFIRVYSPGQSTVAITANDATCTNGTFSITKSSLSPQAYVNGFPDPNLDLSGTIVAAEYYGGQYGVLLMGGVPFVNNNTRVGGTANGDANVPNFGSSQDAINLAKISASDNYGSALSFSVPGTAGHSYKIQMLFHDNYTGTAAVRNRQFDVKVGNGVALAYNLDLALLGANLTAPRDVVLTYSYTNTDGSALPITTASEANNSLISALILKDTTPGYVMPPSIVLNPSSVTNLAGQTVSFQSAALGTAVYYQWQAAPYGSTAYTNLINSGRFSGVNSNTLTIANIRASDGLDYVLKATNSVASALSTPASLGVTILGGLATVTQPSDLGLGVGTVVAAEYYGTDMGPLAIGSTTFYDNNNRLFNNGNTAAFTAPANTPNFGAGQDAANLALISAMDAWGNNSATLDFTVPTTAGRNYLLKLLLHDNVFNTVGTRVFQINAGPQGGALAQLGPQAIDLVNFGDYETQPDDLMLTLGVTNYAGSPIEVQMVGSTQNPLISAIILQDVSAGTVPPIISVQPQSAVTLYSGHTTNLFALVGGTSLIYQWQISTDSGGTWSNLSDSPGSVSGSSTPTLTLTVSASVPNAEYHLVAHNSAGPVTTTPATVTVLTGPPVILTGGDLPTTQFGRVGQTLNLSVGLDGDAPFTCTWQRSTDGGTTWNPVANSGRISGATSNVLTILNAQTNDSGIYQLSVLDDQSGGNPTMSAQDNLSVLFGAAGFGTDGAGWTLNGESPSISGGVFVLTTYDSTQTTPDHRTAFYSVPVYIGAFHAGFTYLDSSGFLGGDAADGGFFALQNDPSGASYLGAGGGGLAYTGLGGPSFALCWDLYVYDPGHIGTPGWLWATNAANVGNSVNPFGPSGDVAFTRTDPINIDLLYYAGQLTLTMTQDSYFFQRVISSINLPAMLGANTAYVGVGGADGGLSSSQQVSNFYFEPLVGLSFQLTSTNTVVFSWEKYSGLVLESTADVASGVWQTVPAGTVAGQAVIPLTSAARQFYRLVAPLP